MFLPLVLLILATLAAAVASYGTSSSLASTFESGLQIICLSRRIAWPLWVLCLLCCLTLLFLVISGKKRAWWLVGLGPILVLFVHAFVTNPIRQFQPLEDPPLAKAEQANTLHDSDNVVGILVAGTPIAYPVAALWRWPIVTQNVYEQEALLLWNPYANLGRAWLVDRDVTAREMEVVATPANATLVYNARYGEFINGVTGRQPSGGTPTGFPRQLPARLTTWGQWRAAHPETKVLLEGIDTGVNRPVVPAYGPVRRRPTTRPTPTETPIGPVVLIETRPALALPAADVSDVPLNLVSPSGEDVVAFRDPTTGEVRAYTTIVGQRFARATTRGFLHEVTTNTPYTSHGKPLPIGPAETGTAAPGGSELTPLLVSEGGWWEVLREWHPDARLHRVGPQDFAAAPAPLSPPEPQRTTPRRRSRR